jgi:hypothetical protein
MRAYAGALFIPSLAGLRRCVQAIIEKFEFFPIKCRVQRSLEMFKLREARQHEGPAGQAFSVQVVPSTEAQPPGTACAQAFPSWRQGRRLHDLSAALCAPRVDLGVTSPKPTVVALAGARGFSLRL